jgi:hypothetical protein
MFEVAETSRLKEASLVTVPVVKRLVPPEILDVSTRTITTPEPPEPAT